MHYNRGFPTAVGCTAAVDNLVTTPARNTNIDGTGVPIYWLNGIQGRRCQRRISTTGPGTHEANDKDESVQQRPQYSSVEVNYPFTGIATTTARRLLILTRARGLGAE